MSEVYAIMVSYQYSSAELSCDEIFGAESREAAKVACENHFKAWAKSLAKTKAIHWASGYVAGGDMSFGVRINKPHYRTYPASYFEELKATYPEQTAFLDNLYLPDPSVRAAKLLEIYTRTKSTLSEGYLFIYAQEELTKLGYVYSPKEQIWYPPNGIQV